MQEVKYDNLRTSIDTLYLGFRTDIDNGLLIFEDLKKVLFSLCYISLIENKNGNIYYWHCEMNKDSGVVVMCEPRLGLKNDFITLQLSGHFFRDIWASRNFLDYIFEVYSSCIILQRVDVALDIMFKEFPSHMPSREGFLCGFPVPSYNENYHYRREGFETYGRMSENPCIAHYFNMVAQGRGDLRLRVYDKTLDCLEKDFSSYSDIYMFETNYEQVYRIEFQCRGKYVKGFVDKYLKHYGCYEYVTLVEAILQYLLQKYNFDGLENDDVLSEIRKPFRFTKLKREATLENQFKYHKALQNKEYYKCCEISDRLQAYREVAKACKVGEDILKDHFADFDMYACDEEFKRLNGGSENG